MRILFKLAWDLRPGTLVAAGKAKVNKVERAKIVEQALWPVELTEINNGRKFGEVPNT